MSNARNFSFVLAAGLALLIAAPAHGQGSSTLTLRQAVTLALQNSRDVKLAQVQYNVALGEAGVNRAAFLPNLYTVPAPPIPTAFHPCQAARPQPSSRWTTRRACSIQC